MLEKLAIVGTIGAGLAIGLLWPASHRGAPAGGAAGPEVVIARSSDHHYYADAVVNGSHRG
jgi:predicted aspartyl protease